jgi:L-cystine uptake protein TcyP (sodium:dicarboxylate symporter family)
MEILIGVLLSGVMQLVKKYISESWRLLVVVLLALAIGIVQFYLKQNVELLKNATAIFAYASGFYVLFLKTVEEKLSK